MERQRSRPTKISQKSTSPDPNGTAGWYIESYIDMAAVVINNASSR